MGQKESQGHPCACCHWNPFARLSGESESKRSGSCLHLLRGAASRLALVRRGSPLREGLLRGARKVLEAGHRSDAPIVLQAAKPAMLQPI